MGGNSFGHKLVLTTFGESHGPSTGGVLDGFPSLIPIDFDFIQSEVNRRRTGQDFYSSSRKEDDIFSIISGVFEGKSTGAPIAFLTENKDAVPGHYEHLKDIYRPSHADYTWDKKFGIRDYRGGGRSSARETLARVIGGAFAKMILLRAGISVTGYVSQIGSCRISGDTLNYDAGAIAKSRLGCPSPVEEEAMLVQLQAAKSEGDTLGGIVSCRITGVPAGLGDPIFDKLSADLARAMLSIPSVKGFDFGSGFSSSHMKGSEHNDIFLPGINAIPTLTNHSGGIQGGISNGNDIYFRAAFKPVPSLMKDQETVNRAGQKVVLKGRGRYDVCIVPRAVVIVEAMAALTIADHYLMQRPAEE